MRARIEHLAQGGDLRLHRCDVGLSAEAGVHRHDEHHLDQVEHVLDGRDRRRRVEGDGGARPEITHTRQGSVEVGRRLGVDDEEIAAGVDVLGRQQVRVGDHEVRLEPHVGVGPAGGDHVGSEREIRHEVAVHDVPLDAIGAGFAQPSTLLAEVGEVGG